MQTIEDSDFLRLVEFVREIYGINLEHKRQLIDARLSFYIHKLGYTGFHEYISYVLLHPDSDECKHMMNRLSTNYTYFFRESEFIKRLSAETVNKDKVHIWCAACSSGEEPYSIAMVLEHQRNMLQKSFDYKIVCTDINTDLLDIARKGKYSISALNDIPESYRRYTAMHTSSDFEISETIRKKMDWRYENLFDSNIKHDMYDIVFCRNVMIYFTLAHRRKIIEIIYRSLRPGGYLFTGATESIDHERKYFHYIAPTFYQKI